ncbi:MAG TPA: AraC family transcriptional regulator [Polyangiales bacterium]|nr:AraC family transcriptional regulator [Polyangiales bacterium]
MTIERVLATTPETRRGSPTGGIVRPGMRKYFTHLDPVVPVHHPRVLVETAASMGADRAQLLENVGISEATLASPEARISYHQYGILTSNALRLTGSSALGLEYGGNIRVGQMGPLGLALMNSPNLGAAIEALLRHSHILLPAFDLSLRVEGEIAILSATETLSLEPFRAFGTEAVLASIDVQIRSVVGNAWTIRAVRLQYPQPEHATRYAEVFGAPISFDQPANEIEFDASLLATPIAFADPATAKLAEQFCAEQLGPHVAEGLLGQVRKLLDSARGPLPNLDQLSRTLQTSPRTLRRSLHAMGTSYQTLLENSRRTRALEWVTATTLTFDEIAKRLGFSDVRSFRRAFKRWTGHTPGDHRRSPQLHKPLDEQVSSETLPPVAGEDSPGPTH